jgi:hypothetical protein
MKIKISKSLKEGLLALRDQPIIFLPIAIGLIISYFLNLYLNKIYLSKIIEKSLPPLPLSPSQITAESFQNITLILASLPLMKIIILLLIGSLISFFLFLVAIDLISNALRRQEKSLILTLKWSIKKFPSVFWAGVLVFLLILVIIFSSIIIAALLSSITNQSSILLVLLAVTILIIFLHVKFIYYPYAGIIDDRRAIESLKASWRITRENWWRTFVLTIITMTATLLLILLTAPFPSAIAAFLGILIQILATAWAIAVFTSAYLQIRI